MTSRNCWHRSLRTPGREQSCTTACARCVSAANSSPSLKNIRRDIPKMPRRFVSVTVSRLRSQEPQGRVLFRANPIVIGVIVIGVIVGASLLCIHVNLVLWCHRRWGMVAEAWFVVIFRIALLLACVAVWRGTGACVCRAQAGDGEGSAQRAGQREFFLW